MTGAALRMTLHHFCLAGAALYTDGAENRKGQLCTQLSISEDSVAELLSF